MHQYIYSSIMVPSLFLRIVHKLCYYGLIIKLDGANYFFFFFFFFFFCSRISLSLEFLMATPKAIRTPNLHYRPLASVKIINTLGLSGTP